MNVGILGSGTLAAATARRLADVHRVHVVSEDWRDNAVDTRIVPEATAAQVARSSEVLLVCDAAEADLQAFLDDPEALMPGAVVVDLRPGDPEWARAMADALQQRGIALIDAPIHREREDALADASVITCGGPAATIASVRGVLEAIGPKVVHTGEAGSGRAARLVIAVVAAANRLVTYECAAMGVRNGLTVDDMATVLTRCSGYNSATVRVLPAIARGDRSADVPLRSVVDDLTEASRLAMRVGAPLLIGNLARSLMQAESNALGASAGLDETFHLFHAAVGGPSAVR